MGIFSKFFSSKPEQAKENDANKRGKYMPEIIAPADQRFTLNFKDNGGKFLYCQNIDEVYNCLEQILEENKWHDEKVLLLDKRLKDLFKSFKLNTTKTEFKSRYFLSTCEYLIADDGSILVSSNQIAEKRLKELPDNLIIYATTSQFVNNIGDGLKGIKAKSKRKIPSNITTIKHFKSSSEEDFLTYGYSSKNLYLLLLEDL